MAEFEPMTNSKTKLNDKPTKKVKVNMEISAFSSTNPIKIIYIYRIVSLIIDCYQIVSLNVFWNNRLEHTKLQRAINLMIIL